MDKYKERKRLLLFGLPLTFTIYTIDKDSLNVKEGFLNTRENDCYLYKIQDVTIQRSLIERIFGLSTIICYKNKDRKPMGLHMWLGLYNPLQT